MKATLARWVSIVAHPFVMIAVMVMAATMHLRGAGDALPNLVVGGGFVIVPLAVLMILQVRRGRWANVDASNRRERPLLYVVGIMAVAALLVYLWIRGAEAFLVRGAATVLVLLLVCAAATRTQVERGAPRPVHHGVVEAPPGGMVYEPISEFPVCQDQPGAGEARQLGAMASLASVPLPTSTTACAAPVRWQSCRRAAASSAVKAAPRCDSGFP
ncbi:hypothetical protein BH23ACI1_BH23ACI1_29810 [soil metagenome]|nr:hypothetical protein [Acidobacteriota bacterium]